MNELKIVMFELNEGRIKNFFVLSLFVSNDVKKKIKCAKYGFGCNLWFPLYIIEGVSFMTANHDAALNIHSIQF